MTKEELKKEAWQYADKVCGWDKTQIFDYLVEAYLASAEPREKRIAELEKENAELKKLKRECETSLCRAEYQYNYEQLTKAKEIIKDLLNLPFASNEEVFADIGSHLYKAEKFLKDSEVEK